MPEKNSGQLKIQDGKLVLSGEVFDAHGTYPFDGFIDTGCTHDLVISSALANAVCAVIDEDYVTSAAAGTHSVEGTLRKVNVRFGGLEAKNITAFVPNGSSSRVLIGIGFLQKSGSFLTIDFHSGATQGGLITTDRKTAFLVGKVLHCLLKHDKEIVTRDPCDYCGQPGKLK